MRFTLDGEVFELTAEIVRARIAGHAPEDIREYWVEVDGVRWPVKQVISLATGAKRSRFQSQDSRRWLQNLGFIVGAGQAIPAVDMQSRRSTPPRRLAFDPSRLEEIEALDVRLSFSWLRAGPVTLDSEGWPLFPLLPKRPGIYRFDLGVDDSGTRTLYIGETVQLDRRGRNYRGAKSDNSSQKTSRRIHKEVVAHLSAGGLIEFAIATDVRWSDGEDLDLRLRSVRRLAENAAVVLAQLHVGTRVLNIDTDLGDSAADG